MLPFLVALLASVVGAADGPIVSSAWVQKHLGSAEMVVVEASWTQSKAPADYNAGHIPGAIHLDTDELENGYPRWQLRPLGELRGVIGKLGIGPRVTVVVYGRKTIAAARVWWVMHYAGVCEVHLLDGGYAAWIRAGYAGETKPNRRVAVTFAAPARAETLATIDYVRAARGPAIFADVRSREEFLGQVSGYDYLDRKGRIPGAIHLDNADDSAAIYQNADGTLRGLDEIRRLWQKRGLPLDDSRELIFYCGTGWRSSLAYLYAVAMGLRRVRNFSDGWAGWSTIYTLAPNDRGSGVWKQTPSGNPVEP